MSTVAQLQAEASAANQRADQTTILLNNGIYKLSHGLSLNNPHMTLRGKSSDPEKVIIEGDKMGPALFHSISSNGNIPIFKKICFSI